MSIGRGEWSRHANIFRRWPCDICGSGDFVQPAVTCPRAHIHRLCKRCQRQFGQRWAKPPKGGWPGQFNWWKLVRCPYSLSEAERVVVVLGRRG
jgi:hypothetical protein